MASQADHPSNQLWHSHHPPEQVYPDTLVAVRKLIRGRAFFPGGAGLWGAAGNEPLPPFPIGGVMVLGHDFHSEEGYEKSLARGAEPERSPTWRSLRKLLGEVPIPVEDCFFTNFYMGLRKGAETTGVFPAAGDRAFVDHCKRFLIQQLRAQRPSLVITLGMQVPPLIATVSEQLQPWVVATSIKALDALGPLRTGVSFPGLPDFQTTVAAIIHPSLRHGSLRYRAYGGKTKNDAEVLLLRDAMEIAFGPSPEKA